MGRWGLRTVKERELRVRFATNREWYGREVKRRGRKKDKCGRRETTCRIGKSMSKGQG